jgi:hypothetical protein
MFRSTRRLLVSLALFPVLALTQHFAFAQETPYFTPGNLLVVVEGCGAHGGTCTSVPYGTGTSGGYGDNQAGPLTLFQYTPNGITSVNYVNSLVLPQSPSGANVQVSGEYGSSSEGGLQLSGSSQYLTLMGYGIDALSFNTAPTNYGTLLNPKGESNYAALGQTGSLSLNSQTLAPPYPNGYTPVPRVLALIDPYGNVNSATALFNIFDFNNPRSAYTLDGSTVYVSGQGSGTDATGGVFYSPVGAANNSPTAITGLDACAASGCTTPTIAQDTRTVQIYNNTLYISIDSTEGKSDNRSLIGTLGTPPATSLFTPTAPPTGYTTGPNIISGLGNTGGTGKETITTGANSNGNAFNVGDQINISPVNYFFASPSVLYVTDDGAPKQTSATKPYGDGGLQKWINSAPDGSGTWSLAYTLYQGLSLVENPTADPSNTTGTTGLFGLAGVVSDGVATLYVTNATIADLDPTFLYGITDTLTTTTNPGTTFALLDTAPSDSNFKGISFAPSLPAGSATITTSPSGLTVSTSGSGCVPGTYTAPVTLIWTPESNCTLSVVSPQGPTGTQYTLTQWQDGSTGTSDSVTAPDTSAVYSATFSTSYQLTTAAGTGGTVSAGGYFTAGTQATITATPNPGYVFVSFTGTTTSTTNPLMLTMNGPQSITANFTPQSSPTTPTVTVTPASSSITTSQPLQVTVSVSGGSGNPTPTGSVTLSSGSYTSAATTLSAGAANITVPAGSLTIGNDTLTGTYTPDSGSSSTYTSATGTAPETVTQACTANPNPNPNPESFAAIGDFDGDCKSDILWRNSGTEQVYEWLMSGTTFTGSGSPGTPTSDWVIQNAGDFDGDGKADILWRNSTTGEVYIWLMNGTTFTSSGSLGNVSSDWSIAGVGDFNGDGKADILWQNTSGQLYLWLMNGTTVNGGGTISTVSSGWNIAGVGDFDGDGKADILWENSTTGQVYVWLMNGTTIVSTGSPGSPTSDWSFAGVGDFDGNGTSDVLWRNSTTGEAYIWFMNGTTFTSSGSLGYVTSDWVIQGVGDYDASGRAGILWRNSGTEQVYIWLINGTTLTSTGSPGSPDATWQIAP